MSFRWHRWLPLALLGAVACNFNPQPDLPAGTRDSAPSAGGSAGNGSLTSSSGGGGINTGIPNPGGGAGNGAGGVGNGAGGVGNGVGEAGAGGMIEEAGAAGASTTAPLLPR